MAVKKYVLTRFEGEDIVFESDGQIVRVPLKEMEEEREQLIKEGVQVPALDVGIEISVGGRCSYHWKMEGCISAYMHNL